MEIYKNIILTILLLTICCDDDKNDLSNEKINNSEELIGYGIGEFSFTGLKFFENSRSSRSDQVIFVNNFILSDKTKNFTEF